MYPHITQLSSLLPRVMPSGPPRLPWAGTMIHRDVFSRRGPKRYPVNPYGQKAFPSMHTHPGALPECPRGRSDLLLWKTSKASGPRGPEEGEKDKRASRKFSQAREVQLSQGH